MKFNCGPTWQEKLKIKRIYKLQWLRDHSNWRPWFAWYPVRIGSRDCRWLEFIDIRLSSGGAEKIRAGEEEKLSDTDIRYYYDYPSWEYRT